MLCVAAVVGAFVSPPLVQRSSSTPRSASAEMMHAVENLRFMTEDQVREVASTHGTPVFVYDEAGLKQQASTALAFPNAYGLTVRFAMKSCPNAAILQTFDRMGLHIDASSGFEVRRAVAAGVDPSKMSLSSQECPEDLGELLDMGIKFNACSLNQLEQFGKLRQGARGDQLGVRFNPGLGSGGTGKTNVGGPSSSFGIWHELMPEVKALIEKYDLEPARVHTHIGSGSDPAVWQKVASLSLDLCEQLGPSVNVLNLGGGYKVGRMATDASTDLAVRALSPRSTHPPMRGQRTRQQLRSTRPRVTCPRVTRLRPRASVCTLGQVLSLGRVPSPHAWQVVGVPVKAAFEAFNARTGRSLHLEVEPGTFLVANQVCAHHLPISPHISTDAFPLLSISHLLAYLSA